MLLDEARKHGQRLGINYDVVLMVDPDIFSVDFRTFMNELYYSGGSSSVSQQSTRFHGLCAHGIGSEPFTQDTFAVVKENGGWLHYGHDAMTNHSDYVYQNALALRKRRFFPNLTKRFESVRSCFGGLTAYKNTGNQLFGSQCRYSLLRDIFWTEYNNTVPPGLVEYNNSAGSSRSLSFKYSYDWWLRNRYHNEYSNRSLAELDSMRKQYVKLLQRDDLRIRKRSLWYRDGDICEHIPFHFCLIDQGFEMAISTRAHLYYFQNLGKVGDQTLAVWHEYWQKRPMFTK